MTTGRGMRAAAGFALVAAHLLLASPAHATKGGDSFIGQAGEPPLGTDADGGLFNRPQGVAADHDTGQVYVADSVNHRIQRFDAEGSFEAAFGRDVVEAGGSGDVVSPNEVQQLSVDATGGTYRLLAPNFLGPGVLHNEHQTISHDATGGTFGLRWKFEGTTYFTGDLPFDASAVEVQAALEGFEPIDPGDVAVTGPAAGPWDVEFTGQYAETDVQQIDSFGSQNNLTGGSSSRPTFADGQYTAPLAHDASAATIEAALQALDAIVAGNVTVSGAGPSDVEFTGAHAAADVKQLGADPAGLSGGAQSATVTTTLDGDDAFEVCVVASECRAGRPGAQGGMFDNPTALAIDPDSGDLYAIDRDNGRIQHFSFGDAGTPADPSDDVPVFEGAWGSNTIPDGATGNLDGPDETQRFSVQLTDTFGVGPPSGDFTLSFEGQTTAPIEWPPSAASIETGLEGLPNVAPGDVSATEPQTTQITGNRSVVSFEVTFEGAHANTNVPQTGLDSSGIEFPGGNGSVSSSTSTPIQGDSNYEVCAVAAECRAGQGGQVAGSIGTASDNSSETFFGSSMRDLDVSKDGAPGAGQVFLADSGNRRVQQFSVDGGFQRAFGHGVDSGAEEFEICTAASQCQGGATNLSGSPNGSFGSNRPQHLATDAAGVLYVEDGNRIMRFDTTVAGEDEAAAESMLLPDPYLSAGPPTPEKPLQSGVPSGLEVDPASGNLLYLVDSSGDTFVQELDTSTNPPLEVDRHMEGAGSEQPVGGLGLLHGPGGDRLYVSGDGPGGGVIDHRVLILDDDGAPPIEVTIDPASELSATEATLSGTLDVNGPSAIPASHRFQYSSDGGETWVEIPPSDGPFDDDAVHVVDETLTALDPGTDYQARLIASRLFNGAFAQTAGPVAFSTLPLTPAVQTTATTLRTATSATLTGRLNPNGTATEWRFEWGSDDSYGNLTPLELATGAAERTVTATIEGLDPQTTYHYRLIADNGEEEAPGDSVIEGADATVTTRAEAAPPPARAYEMVTSPDKPNRRGETQSPVLGIPDAHATPGLSSLDGERILWSAGQGTLNSFGTGFPHAFGWELIERGPGGWEPDPVFNIPAIDAGVDAAVALDASSADLLTQNWRIESSHFPSGSSHGTRVFGWQGGFLSSGWQDFTGAAPNPHIGTGSDSGVAGDGRTFTIRYANGNDYRGLLGANAEADPSNLQVAGAAPYLATPASDWLPQELISECTAGTEIPAPGPGATIGSAPCGPGEVTHPYGAAPGGGNFGLLNAASGDGRRAFFTSPDPRAGAPATEPPQLFVRQWEADGSNPRVRWISRSEVEGQDATGLFRAAAFEDASTDGRYVFFRTNQPLTVDDPNAGSDIQAGTAQEDSWDLYRYELPEDLGDDPTGPEAGGLVRITGGATGTADPNTNSRIGSPGSTPREASIRHLSADGERVYYVTRGALSDLDADNTPPAGGATTAAGDVSQNETRNLYLYDGQANTYKFIARLPYSSSTSISNCASSSPTPGFGGGNSCVHGSTSGDAILFVSPAQLTTDDTDEAADVYLYDAAADELTRVSVPPESTAPYACGEELVCNAGLGFGPRGADVRGLSGMRQYNLSENPDGTLKAVYFDTRLPLTGSDQNGLYFDTYEWRRADGRLSLISPGDSSHHAFYSGNGLDGQNVFFHTTQRISPWEIDEADGDIYAARVGGGLPGPPPPPAICDVLGGSCEGPSPTPPAPGPGAATAAISGGGNVSGTSRPRANRCARRALAARKAAKAAKRLRRASRQAARRGQAARAHKLSRRAARRADGARRANRAARRCRARARAAKLASRGSR
ncbi:MAG: hypothetical protein WD649_04550 [Thermoleophilaceae bacterium]